MPPPAIPSVVKAKPISSGVYKPNIRYLSPPRLAALSPRSRPGIRRIAYGTPYSVEATLQGKALLEESGFTVVNHGILENVTIIYDETPERAYRLGRSVDKPDAQAVFLSGTGMPTIGILEMLEQDLGKPAVSAASAMMWQALRLAGVRHCQPGYGRLFASSLGTDAERS